MPTGGPKSATSGLMRRSKLPDYSITSSARAAPDWSRSRRFSVQPILRHRVTRLVHRLQLPAAQEDHLGPQPAARGDPPLHRRRIHRMQHHGYFAISEGAAVEAETIRGMETKR